MRDVAESPHTAFGLLGTFQDATKLYMCTEVVMGGELFNRLNRVGGTISERDAAFYAACVALGLEYMQRKHYVYRDLKPENLLVDERGYVKIADFGFAKRLMPGERAYTLCGTPGTWRPSCLSRRGTTKAWTGGPSAFGVRDGVRKPAVIAPDGDGAADAPRAERQVRVPERRAQDLELVRGLRQKIAQPEQRERLGCLRDGAADVKRHPWLAENADFRA